MTLAGDQDAVHTHTILFHRGLNFMRVVKRVMEARVRYETLHGVFSRNLFRDGGDETGRSRALLCI